MGKLKELRNLMKIIDIYVNQIHSSTIGGNVEFVHSQYSCILTSQVSIKFLCPAKLFIKMIILEYSAHYTVNQVQFYVFFIFSFYTFLFNIGKHVN